MRRLLLPLACAAAIGCGDDPKPAPADASPDVAADAADATGEDADPDAGGEDVDAAAPDAEPEVDAGPTALDKIVGVAESERWALEGLSAPAHVVRTEGNVPHVYAKNRRDLSFMYGFVVARDRYFQLDLTRRFGLGRVSELLGDAALSTDREARGNGMTFVADNMIADLTPAQAELFDAFAEGINAYAKLAKEGKLPVPAEYDIAGPLVGAEQPSDLMVPFTRRDVAGMAAAIIYNLGYETGDVGRAAAAAQLDELFEGAPLQDLRRAGARHDIWERVAPVKPISSAAGFGVETAEGLQPGPTPTQASDASSGGKAAEFAGAASSAAHRRVPASLLTQLAEDLDRFQKRMRRDWSVGFGSNAWAVAGDASADGFSWLAGDGHLPLTIPSLFYQIGLDDALLGGGDTQQLGMGIPGMPTMAVGTNGKVAWCQTQLMGDITDWYAEEVQLGDDGLPSHTRFQGEWKPVQRFDEEIVVADVPLLGSEGRTETMVRLTTFDGRWLTAVEGRKHKKDEVLGEGEGILTLMSGDIVPGDQDGDGVVTAVSFDYAGLDGGAAVIAASDAFGHAGDVEEFRQATRGLVAYSQNIVASDAAGDILYTGYQPVPCRGYLERDAEGRWADGADPNLLLDGTKYGGFTIPLKDQLVDEAAGEADPYECVVPLASYPQAISPARGFVQTANNDPGNISIDGSLTDDPWYIGGPWTEGYRADTIHHALETQVAANSADLAAMATLQANVQSRLGEQLVPFVLEAIDAAKAAHEAEAAEGADGRLAALYAADAEAVDAVRARLAAWGERGFWARSGVETFYAQPTEDDRADAVATTLYNAWQGAFMGRLFDDEGLPGLWQGGGNTGRIRAVTDFVEGRGPDNPGQLASWNPDTQESAFFDIKGTAEVETSRELAMLALQDALTFLRSAPTSPGKGGFGDTPMEGWLWGLRHMVRFDSMLLEFLGDQPGMSLLADQFSITPARLPLASNMPAGDPRATLPHFPRDGDQFAVDAANPGFSGKNFSYGSGPVFRMVIGLKDGQVVGQNVLPGGQSGLPDSEFFDDQAALWLGNQTIPLRFHLDDVVEGAIGREIYEPAP